jgi:E3 ubiquitin-protein ligase RFWD2
MLQRTRQEMLNAKKRRVHDHFKDLQAYYFSCRRSLPGSESLSEFLSSVSKFTRYTKLKVCSTLKHGDLFNGSNIVSCIDFDRDDEFFATGGVARKIKIFEYSSIVSGNVSAHYPVREMVCESKISSLSWNSYIKNQIASSDYEGVVTVWDTNVGTPIVKLDEHEKRVWCVDFSPSEPTRLASGSDDAKVKIWSTNARNAVMTIDSKANVCSVKFNPGNSDYIAFGSADHNVHYYDLRNTSAAVNVYRGHRKAVSYVKFMSRTEFVSASTDSSLKLWVIGNGL